MHSSSSGSGDQALTYSSILCNISMPPATETQLPAVGVVSIIYGKSRREGELLIVRTLRSLSFSDLVDAP